MSKFAYMNFNPYTVLIHLSTGTPLAVPQNNGVKGEFFAKFAAPVGPLTQVHAERVIKSHIIKTMDDITEAEPVKVTREKVVVPKPEPVKAVKIIEPVEWMQPVVEPVAEVEPAEEQVEEVEEVVEESVEEEELPAEEQKSERRPFKKGKNRK